MSNTAISEATPSPSKRPMRVLLLCDYDPYNARTVVDNIDAFLTLSRHQYVMRSGRGDLLAGVDLSDFDGILIHYSLVACYDNYLAPASRRRIRTFQGYKAVYIQDEYRFINNTIAALNYMKIHALFSVIGPETIDGVYSEERLPGVYKTTVLTGYVPDNLIGIQTPAYEDRVWDVTYRARKVPAYLGEHGLQKWQIAERFAADADRYGLTTDLSSKETDRLYGQAWIDFVASSRAVLCTESGASVCDFTGEIQVNVENHLHHYPDTTFEKLRDLYFKEEDGKHIINCISPRCFEAISLHTLLIMYEGRYSGVMEPWKHYVPLKRDHSNMDEVVAVLRDATRVKEITDRAYEDVIASGKYNYQSMVDTFDTVMESLVAKGLPASPRPKKVTSPVILLHTMQERLLYSWHYICNLPEFTHRNLVILVNSQAPIWFSRYPVIREVVKALYRRGLRILHAIRRHRQRRSGNMPKKHSSSEWFRLRMIQRFFLGEANSEVHFYLNPEEKRLDIVALPANTPPLPGTGETLSQHALRQMIREGKIQQLHWINRNILGLGSYYPYEKHYAFDAIIQKPTWLADGLMIDVIGTTWPDAIYLTSAKNLES